jgi:uncharacterized membrane protein YbhN (UPF0104 family)
MGYLTGTLGNVLPRRAVLGYRAFQDWLPIIPGVLAYLRLLRTVRGSDEGPSS